MLAILFIDYSLMLYFMYYNNALTNTYTYSGAFKTPCNFIVKCVLCIIVIEHTIIVVTATRFLTSHYSLAEQWSLRIVIYFRIINCS